MKKSFKHIFLFALVAFTAIAFTSCGGYSDSKAKEMIIKSEDDKLKKEDYAEMIQWYEDINNKYLDKWGKILNDKTDYLEYSLDMVKLEADMKGNYPYFSNIRSILSSADEEEMGKANYNKYEKLVEKADKRIEKYNEKVQKMSEKYVKKKMKKQNNNLE